MKSEDQNYYLGELGGQLGVICAIQIIDSIMGSNPLVVDSCDNISTLRRYLIHPELVALRWKQSYLFPCMWTVTAQLTPACC